MDFYQKYIKYKTKYVDLREQVGGAGELKVIFLNDEAVTKILEEDTAQNGVETFPADVTGEICKLLLRVTSSKDIILDLIYKVLPAFNNICCVIEIFSLYLIKSKNCLCSFFINK